MNLKLLYKHGIVLKETKCYYFYYKSSNTISVARPMPGFWNKEINGLCHRLDKDVGGINIVAKSNCALYYLLSLFKRRLVKKYYIAVVRGNNITKQTLRGRLVWNHNMQKSYVKRIGKLSITKIIFSRNIGPYSLLLIKLGTGRRHQIRVQLANMGYPILGDAKYGKKYLPNHMFLHSVSYGFIDHENEVMSCTRFPKIWSKFFQIWNKE